MLFLILLIFFATPIFDVSVIDDWLLFQCYFCSLLMLLMIPPCACFLCIKSGLSESDRETPHGTTAQKVDNQTFSDGDDRSPPGGGDTGDCFLSPSHLVTNWLITG